MGASFSSTRAPGLNLVHWEEMVEVEGEAGSGLLYGWIEWFSDVDETNTVEASLLGLLSVLL